MKSRSVTKKYPIEAIGRIFGEKIIHYGLRTPHLPDLVRNFSMEGDVKQKNVQEQSAYLLGSPD
jgi:hypothetical protein